MRRRKGKRGNGEGSIYQRAGDGKWVGSFSLSGKRYAAYGDTADEARRRRDAKRTELDAGGGIAPVKLTLGEFVSRWLAESAPLTCGERTLKTYADNARLHLSSSLVSKVSLLRLSSEDISKWLMELRGKRVPKGTSTTALSPSTIHGCWRMVRAALNVAKSWKLISENPCVGVRMPKPPKSTIELLSIEQARVFLSAVQGHRLEALFTLAICVGMRRGELVGLRVSDVDLVAGRLEVRKQVQRVGGGKVIEIDPKCSSQRSLLLPPFVLQAMIEHGRRRLKDSLVAGSEWHESERFFVTQTGRQLDERNLVRQFHKIREKIGRPDLRFHDLRHSAATLLHVAGVPVTAIQHLLGHQSDRTTRDVYLHVVPAAERAAADTIDGLLGKRKKGKKAS